ncbi:MAG: polyprenol monophosphomannose synthase [Acidimicrobiia bacterium]
MSVLIVLPTYNESENIERILGAIRSECDEADVLVVDDGSPDGTAEIVERVANELGRIELLRRGSKGGLGAAYRAGFRVGLSRGYSIIIEMDADFSHDPARLNDLIAPVRAGEAELVIGSRYVPGGSTPDWPRKRRVISRTGNRYLRLMLRLPIQDATAGFRAYSATALEGIDLAKLQAGGYVFQVEMADQIVRNGGRIKEVPITFHDRAYGNSKMSGKIVREAFWLVTKWGVRRRIASFRGQKRTSPNA